MISEKKKASNAKWDKANMTTLACHVRRDYADQIRQKAKDQGIAVNQILKQALDDFMEDGS